MMNARTSTEHGASHMVWIYRNRGDVLLAIGWLSNYDDGTGRAGRIKKLYTFRHLMPGRYDLTMARYGEAWPVTLEQDPDDPDERAMLVRGRVPV